MPRINRKGPSAKASPERSSGVSGAGRTGRFAPYLMLVPALAGLSVFVVYPLAYLVQTSFTDRSMLNPKPKFVGLANYGELFASEEFRSVAFNSFLYTTLFVLGCLTAALVLAVRLNKPKCAYGFAQSAVFMPYIVSFVTVSLVWLWLMDPQTGLFNSILAFFGLPAFPWLADVRTVIPSLVLVSVWKYAGYYMLLLIAALQNIPREIYEAARIDGAPGRTVFFRITFPLISPSLFFVLVIATSEALRIFDPINIMTQGGPINASSVFVYFIYEYAFKYFRIGYASSGGVVLFILISALVALYFNRLGKKVHYQ